MLVDFFIVGAQKSGTTALYRAMTNVHGLNMSAIKEPHFFDNEGLDWNSPNYAELHRHFVPGSVGGLRGEATPIYAYWPNSIERIRAYNPCARIILLLKHPVYRAFSHWHHEVRRQAEELEFDVAVSLEGRRRVSESPGGVHRIHSYVERGFYSRQIHRIHSHFAESQVLLLTTDELWSSPNEVGRKLSDFLKVDVTLDLPSAQSLPGRPPMDESARRLLFDVFDEELAALEVLGLTGSEQWSSLNYREPFRDA